MNALARQLLEQIWAEARVRQRNARHCIMQMLFAMGSAQYAEVERRATRLWMIADPAWLQAEFDKRLSPEGFNVGFGWDISDVDEEGEQWAAAWQLALEDFELHPARMPVYTDAEVEAWVAARTSPMGSNHKPKPFRAAGPSAP